ncbi:MAG: EAL domain-containing protein [Pseudomonadota bacterium]
MSTGKTQYDPCIEDIIAPGREVLVCTPETPLHEAAGRMSRATVSSIVVVDEGRPVGIWTEHDSLAIDLSRPGALDTPIGEVMSSPVRQIDPDARLSDAAHFFREWSVRHLLVVDPLRDEPRGILSLTDVILNQGIEHYLHFRSVGTLLGHEVVRVAEDEPVSRASQRMRQVRVDAVLVTLGDGGNGILTERDLVGLIAARRGDPPVGEVCTRDLHTVAADASLYHVRNLMDERGVRHIGVKSEDGVEGLVSFADMLTGIELAYVEELRQALEERDSALASSQRNLQLAEKVMQTSLEGIMITDRGGRITRVNPAFTDLTGYTPDEVIGKSPSILQSGRHDRAFYDRMWTTLDREGQWRGEIWNRRKNGEIYPELLTITAIRDENDRITHYAALFSDISEIKENERQIRHLAYYDPLTGLPNRRLFHDRVSMAVAHAHRFGGMLAVMFVDLDRFKTVNDTLGHSAGDEMLETVATRLKGCLREDDSVARIGGDEFLVLLPEVEDFQPVVDVARRVIDVLAEPIRLGDRELVVGCSIGVSFYPDDGLDVDELIRHADIAMYRAKQRGRNTYALFTPAMHEAARRRLNLEIGMRRALEEDAFCVHYQPVVDACRGEMIGTEALLRWRHPEWGLVNPGEFIPLAEETGLILSIGQQLFRKVVEQAVAWRGRLRIAFNLSARQFADPGLAPFLEQCIDAAGLPGDAMTLEITETALMQDVDEHVAVMQRLRSRGFRFAIDDFGTGYSSLAYLRRFPLDYLKIDQAFTAEILHCADARSIVEATIVLAHSLRLRVVAEGVESLEQADLLRDMGADYLQGFFLGHPQPAECLLP